MSAKNGFDFEFDFPADEIIGQKLVKYVMSPTMCEVTKYFDHEYITDRIFNKLLIVYQMVLDLLHSHMLQLLDQSMYNVP